MWQTLKKWLGMAEKEVPEKSQTTAQVTEAEAGDELAQMAALAKRQAESQADKEDENSDDASAETEQAEPEDKEGSAEILSPLEIAMKRRREKNKSATDDEANDSASDLEDDKPFAEQDVDKLVSRGFAYQREALIDYVDQLLEHPKLDWVDQNTLRIFNNYLIALLHTKQYEKGAEFADGLQGVASHNPHIYHNAACCYCFTEQLDKALEQIELGRQHGGMALMDLLRDDDELAPIMEDPRWLVAVNPTPRLAEPELVRIPEAGIKHPFFSTLANDECITLVATYAEALADEDYGVLERQLENLDLHNGRMAVNAGHEGYALSIWGCDDVAAMLADAQRQMLLFRTDASSFLVYKQALENGEPGSVIPIHAEHSFADFETQEEFWAASFSDGPYPNSEDTDGMFAIASLEGGGKITELRPDVLVLDDVRISYRLAAVENLAPTERAATLCATLYKALHTMFVGEVPSIWHMEGGENERFDCIERDGRKGYSFAIKRDLFLSMIGASQFRYKEHELMMAIRETIQAHDLAPVIHWERDSVYIINLWEK